MDVSPSAPLSRPALFVYYQVPFEHASALAAQVAQCMADLRQAHEGLQARRWVRTDAPRGGDTAAQTWMETYEHPHGVSAALAAEIEARMGALAAHGMGQRHAETFGLVREGSR